ncbi:MAG: hypothetical protein Q8O76_13920, partial [Chloroflexota bacterium]|nr:hypothetical protein [Chloroflexota bacterium]
PKEQMEQIDAIVEASRAISKPIAVVLRTSGAPESIQQSSELQQRCFQARLPTYTTIGRASRSIAKLVEHRAAMARLYP